VNCLPESRNYGLTHTEGARCAQQKLKFTKENFKNARGVAALRLAAQVAMICNVNITTDHAQGRLVFALGNVMRTGIEHLAIPAPEIGEAWLEDFARILLGAKTDLGKYRVAPPVR